MGDKVDRLLTKLSKIWIPPHMSVTAEGKPVRVEGYWRRAMSAKDLTLPEMRAVQAPALKHALAWAEAQKAQKPALKGRPVGGFSVTRGSNVVKSKWGTKGEFVLRGPNGAELSSYRPFTKLGTPGESVRFWNERTSKFDRVNGSEQLPVADLEASVPQGRAFGDVPDDEIMKIMRDLREDDAEWDQAVATGENDHDYFEDTIVSYLEGADIVFPDKGPERDKALDRVVSMVERLWAEPGGSEFHNRDNDYLKAEGDDADNWRGRWVDY